MYKTCVNSSFDSSLETSDMEQAHNTREQSNRAVFGTWIHSP